MKTLYDLLGVDAGASQAQIEQGYKRLLDRYLERPQAGRNDGETRRMQNIREAYLLLCSPQKRKSYDQQLHMFRQMRRGLLQRIKLWPAVAVAAAMLAGSTLVYHSTIEPRTVADQTIAARGGVGH